MSVQIKLLIQYIKYIDNDLLMKINKKHVIENEETDK